MEHRIWDDFVYTSQLPTFAAAGNAGVADRQGDGTAACEATQGALFDRIRLPGGGFNIITIGSHNDENGMAASSSAMDTGTQHDKPDFSAPEVSIATQNTASNSNGTNSATPHAAAVLANLIQEMPNLNDAALAKACLTTGSRRPIVGPVDATGVGGLNRFTLLPEYTSRTFDETFGAGEFGLHSTVLQRELELRENHENVRM